jgi:hypothetical protein
MRYSSTPVRSALALAGALLGVAPAGRKLVVRVGAPIPFHIALPQDAEIEAGPGLLSTRIGELLVVAVAKDMMEDQATPAPGRGDFSRRVLTSMIMGSDALLFALLDEELDRRKLGLGNVVRGIGLLGGKRAACVRGCFEERGAKCWLDMHATVKDGIMYMLAFTVLRGGLEPHEALLRRIHHSFELPGAG